MNQATRIFQLNGLSKRPFSHLHLVQRSFFETRLCSVPTRGGGRQNSRKAPRRQRSMENGERQRRAERGMSASQWGNPISFQHNAGGRTNNARFSTQKDSCSMQKERNKAVLCLASNWTKPTPRTSSYPAVLEVLNGLQGR